MTACRHMMIDEILYQGAREIGLVLSDENVNSFKLFALELKKWNSRINLSAITCDNEIVIKHFLDSLYLASYINVEDKMLDIGSGAGFPVIPLKIVKPETIMLSVDAVAKKVNFQRHLIRSLKLQEIKVIHARVEDLQETHANKFSIITSRAFARLDKLVSLAAPLLASGGRLVAMKSADVEHEIAACSDRLLELGFVVTSIFNYSLSGNMGKHSLVEIRSR